MQNYHWAPAVLRSQRILLKTMCFLSDTEVRRTSRILQNRSLICSAIVGLLVECDFFFFFTTVLYFMRLNTIRL